MAHGACAVKRELHTQQRGKGVIDSPILGPLQRSSGHSRQSAAEHKVRRGDERQPIRGGAALWLDQQSCSRAPTSA